MTEEERLENLKTTFPGLLTLEEYIKLLVVEPLRKSKNPEIQHSRAKKDKDYSGHKEAPIA